jgi:hypothetical protein
LQARESVLDNEAQKAVLNVRTIPAAALNASTRAVAPLVFSQATSAGLHGQLDLLAELSRTCPPLAQRLLAVAMHELETKPPHSLATEPPAHLDLMQVLFFTLFFFFFFFFFLANFFFSFFLIMQNILEQIAMAVPVMSNEALAALLSLAMVRGSLSAALRAAFALITLPAAADGFLWHLFSTNKLLTDMDARPGSRTRAQVVDIAAPNFAQRLDRRRVPSPCMSPFFYLIIILLFLRFAWFLYHDIICCF